ncbi:MAG TPA: PAS domain S-box protein [Coleofasciculaceae cyanobacterium]
MKSTIFKNLVVRFGAVLAFWAMVDGLIYEQPANPRLKQERIVLQQTQREEAVKQIIFSHQSKQSADNFRPLIVPMRLIKSMGQQDTEAVQNNFQTTVFLSFLSTVLIGLLILLYHLIHRSLMQHQQGVLKQAKDELEIQMVQRTAELLKINKKLELELEESQRTQEALRISRVCWAGILEIADDAIISINPAQQITLFNQGAEKIFGYTAQEVLGQSLNLLLPLRFAQIHRQHIANFDQATSPSRTMGERREIFGRRKDGTEFPAEASISRLDLGKEKVFTVILRDVTARKQAEKALQDAVQKLNFHFENSPIGVIEWDQNFRISRWSTAAEKIFGWRAEEVLGKHPSDWQFIWKADWQTHPEPLPVFFNRSQQPIVSTHRNYRKDGSVIQCEWYNSALLDSSGHIESLLSLVLDVTERQQVERMKNEFISVVSHELRTPLTSIHGSLKMLESGLLISDSEKGKRLLQIAVASSDRMIRLINDILDITRIESGKVFMERRLCSVSDLVSEAINIVQPLADTAGITLSTSIVTAPLWADPDRIIQTLTNLLSNSIKFSPAGSIVKLVTQCQTNQVLFQVQDQGRGVPSDQLETIFERFQQVDSSDSRSGDGTGLGLAICRSIVQQHSGQIWVESVLGKGSTFYFTLPLANNKS